MKQNILKLEEELNFFDLKIRRNALLELSKIKDDPSHAGKNVNMHFHSFFSYNSEVWSPSRIAWEAKKAGLYAAGLCDFDVLDGLDEFWEACEILELRATINLETRAYLNEYCDSDINSPGEAGVTYIMGAGFTEMPEAGSSQNMILADYRQGAKERNIALIKRINAKLIEIAINYDNDVLPLTPSGAATERHIISAYINKAESVFADKNALVDFWSKIFDTNKEETNALINNLPKLEDITRTKLAKRGGIGYVQPSIDTFPSVDEFIKWVASCNAIPMMTWLDGISNGESDANAMLTCMKDKGATALNIIPDRNWNIADPASKSLKVAKLAEIIEAADAMGLPINIGTEMNKCGQPFADDLDGEVLNKHKDVFLKGAQIMVGHTILTKFANFPYCGTKASEKFSDIYEMNLFFEAVGALPPLSVDSAEKLRKMGTEKALIKLTEMIDN
ncbi:MAG: hypothetical protein KOO69_04175 [Victivallales bacterium]|nr:hypothetical protein [Victivallales bacterium]